MQHTSEASDTDRERSHEAMIRESERREAHTQFNTSVAFAVALGAIVFFVRSDGLPNVIDLTLCLIALAAILLFPIESVLQLIALHGTGVRVQKFAIPPFAIRREGSRLRIAGTVPLIETSARILPTSSTFDKYEATEVRLTYAAALGTFAKAIVLSIATVAIVLETTAAAIIPGLFGISALWTLLAAVAEIRVIPLAQERERRFPEFQRAWRTINQAAALFAEGTRPRDIDPALFNDMLNTVKETPGYVVGRKVVAMCLLDRGQAEEAHRLIQEGLASSVPIFAGKHTDIVQWAAFSAAHVRRDPIAARQLLGDRAVKSETRDWPYLIEATIRLSEGNLIGAEQSARAGLALIPKTMLEGDAAFRHDCLEAIIVAVDRFFAEE